MQQLGVVHDESVGVLTVRGAAALCQEVGARLEVERNTKISKVKRREEKTSGMSTCLLGAILRSTPKVCEEFGFNYFYRLKK